ncbi:unnamed protein product [Mytilus coruscus]|uniref:Uncharacterized protein n=1 Tax=Mytilus coruscus TaxID=42192 RepID=A0A6J8A7A1_MYTCO|nr:unnamed protein product [Mytilus coruscus]
MVKRVTEKEKLTEWKGDQKQTAKSTESIRKIKDEFDKLIDDLEKLIRQDQLLTEEEDIQNLSIFDSKDENLVTDERKGDNENFRDWRVDNKQTAKLPEQVREDEDKFAKIIEEIDKINTLLEQEQLLTEQRRGDKEKLPEWNTKDKGKITALKRTDKENLTILTSDTDFF